ncbi:single-stranded DNA-binding protein, mitochondrial-like [Tubulanus polymorphus]|uniref:single-stranded DNA-binding protein, mitochondrial-like n=1 Tax=Tubulanus polymorphus TaxID=672921 RepID=UPI003DA67301
MFALFRNTLKLNPTGTLRSFSVTTRFTNDGNHEYAEEAQTKRFEKCVNQAQLLGRIGNDPEIRGNERYPVVMFSLATNLSFKRADGNYTQRTDWHRISVFKPGLRENVAMNLRKGDRIFVTGAIRYDEYESNGNMMKSTSVIADDIVNLTKIYLQQNSD